MKIIVKELFLTNYCKNREMRLSRSTETKIRELADLILAEETHMHYDISFISGTASTDFIWVGFTKQQHNIGSIAPKIHFKCKVDGQLKTHGTHAGMNMNIWYVC